MPKRKTLDEIKNELAKLSNDTITILSDTYINSKTPLVIRCSCGSIFERDYEHLKRGRFLCEDCVKERQSQHFRNDISEVIDYINNTGCKYISGEYKNQNSKLLIQCKCGNIYERSFEKFKRGHINCSECANKIVAETKQKYSENNAEEILNSYGYKMIGKFQSASEKVDCICPNGHECTILLSQLISKRHSGCLQCARDNRKGSFHPNYKGGISRISDDIRKSLKDWRINIRCLYNNTCPISLEKGDKNTVVHHLISFDDILNSALEKFNLLIDSRNQIYSISDEELELLRKEVLSNHQLNIGILISKEIHKLFHHEYGYGNNTPSQFNEFLNKHYNINLDDILLPSSF